MLELGLHLGAKLLGERKHRRKRTLILDAEQHRYDKVLSDISGQDIEVHKNEPDEAIRCVRNWLSEHRPPKSPPLPGAAAMQGDYRQFQADIRGLLEQRRLDPDNLTHDETHTITIRAQVAVEITGAAWYEERLKRAHVYRKM
jgi:hypothetical protein